MTKWLLLVWLQANDASGPPISEPVVIEKFDTFAACRGAKLVYAGANLYHIAKRRCKKDAQGKEGGR